MGHEARDRVRALEPSQVEPRVTALIAEDVSARDRIGGVGHA